MSSDLQRIEHIYDYCTEIQKTIVRYGASFEIFDNDPDYQRSISFSILQIGELSGSLSLEYRRATASRVQWGPMKGMRNLVAHNYGSMSRDIIWETALTDIPVLKDFCQEQLSEFKLERSPSINQICAAAKAQAAELNADKAHTAPVQELEQN